MTGSEPRDVRDVDVVVVGAGVAGLSAALAAAQRGLRVALLERSSAAETGGNTRYTEAFLRMRSLDEAADGLEETILGDFMGHPDPGIVLESTRDESRRSALARAHHIADPDYVATLAEQAGPTLRWMQACGVRFDQLPTPFLTTSTTRWAPVGGGLAIVETLGAAARTAGVAFSFQTTARSLVLEDGVVTGVDAHGPDGPVRFRGEVVLACGGFEGNPEMMARYTGPNALTTRPVARGGHYNKGEGIEMALDAGAATAGNFALFHAEPVDPRSGAPEAAIFCFPYGVLVNLDGDRFVDEARGPVDAWYERVTRIIQAQREGIAYVVLDAQGMAVPNIQAAIRTDQPPITAGTVAELADRIGVPAARLQATLDAFNAACPDGAFDPTAPDGLATRGLTPGKSHWATPIRQAPFTALPIMAANVFTFGGLKVTARSEVVDRDGRPIPGLYAAGEITGLYYSNYTGSTSVLRGAVFGRIAAEQIAERSGTPAGDVSDAVGV